MVSEAAVWRSPCARFTGGARLASDASAGWESIKRADSDTLAIGQSVSARAWEPFAKSHRSGNPVRQITFVTMVVPIIPRLAIDFEGCASLTADWSLLTWQDGARTSAQV